MSNCYTLVLGLRSSLVESNSLAGDTGSRIVFVKMDVGLE